MKVKKRDYEDVLNENKELRKQIFDLESAIKLLKVELRKQITAAGE
jgi:cell division septum initiation protein DivIVA